VEKKGDDTMLVWNDVEILTDWGRMSGVLLGDGLGEMVQKEEIDSDK
jgi:hypothetical protein